MLNCFFFSVPSCQKEYEKINSYTPCAIPSCFRTYGSVIPKAITLLSKKENNGGQSIVSQLDVIKSSSASEGSLLWHFSYCELARKTWWLYWERMIHSVGNAFSSHAQNNGNWENACKLIAYNFGGDFHIPEPNKDCRWHLTIYMSIQLDYYDGGGGGENPLFLLLKWVKQLASKCLQQESLVLWGRLRPHPKIYWLTLTPMKCEFFFFFF